MDAEDWLKSVEKKLEIAQCSEKVLSMMHQLCGTVTDWWETYRNTHPNVEAITLNEFEARFRTHYVTQGSMMVNEYLNQFIQL